MKAKSLKDHINRGRYRNLLTQAQQSKQLSQLVRLSLPQFKNQLDVGCFRDGILSLVCHSSSIATPLKYMCANLIRDLKIHPELNELKKITVIVDPKSNVIKQPSTKKKPLHKTNVISDQAKLAIAEGSEGIQDTKLKIAWLKLCTH